MRLNLKKETLAELTDGELQDVVGASFRTKYECTESYQVCNPLSVDICFHTR
ncbi:MAG TPA: class I lanthipeptide [Mycobacteriales bacterium]